MATPVAYKGSWARGYIQEAPVTYAKAVAKPILNPLNQAGDRAPASTATQAATVGFPTHGATVGTPRKVTFKSKRFTEGCLPKDFKI